MTGDTNHPTRCILGRVTSHVARGILIALFICAAHPAFAKHKKQHSHTWSDGTTVETQVAGGVSNPMCQSITANLSKRVDAIKVLRASYDKAAAAPPTSVASALEGMFGSRQPDANMRDIERKIKGERKSADDLNDMLRAQKCVPVDIEAALAAKSLLDQGAPVVPKGVPDDILQAPRQY